MPTDPEKRREINKRWNANNQEYYKQYKEDRKEHYQHINSEYYFHNKETINEKQCEVITCELCGGTYTKSNKARHQRTERCTEGRIKIKEEQQ